MIPNGDIANFRGVAGLVLAALALRSSWPLLAVLVSACSYSMTEIKPAQVGANEYAELDCMKVVEGFQKISDRIFVLTSYRQPDQNRNLVKIVWPSENVLQDNPALLAQLQKMRGEADALETTAIAKRCTTLLMQETSTQFSFSSVSPSPHPTEPAAAPAKF